MDGLWKTKKGGIALLFILGFAELVLFMNYGYHWTKIARYLVLSGFLAVIACVDYKKTIIPNKLLLYMLLIRGVLLAAELFIFTEYRKEILISSFGGLGTGFLIFLLSYILSRKSIGLGDVKLAAVIGWYLGSALIWMDVIIALSLAAGYSIIQLVRKKLTMKDSIPLAPFSPSGRFWY